MEKRDGKDGAIKDNKTPQNREFTEADIAEIAELYDPESVQDWIVKHKERLGGSPFEVYEKISALKKKMALDDVKKLRSLDEKIESIQAQINEIRAQDRAKLSMGSIHEVDTNVIRRHEKSMADIVYWNGKVTELKNQIKELKGFWGIPGLLRGKKIKEMEMELQGFESAIDEKKDSTKRDKSVYEMYLRNREANKKIEEKQHDYVNSLPHKKNEQLIQQLFDEKDFMSKERDELFEVLYGHSIFFDPSLLEGERPDQETIMQVIKDNIWMIERQDGQERKENN